MSYWACALFTQHLKDSSIRNGIIYNYYPDFKTAKRNCIHGRPIKYSEVELLLFQAMGYNLLFRSED